MAEGKGDDEEASPIILDDPSSGGLDGSNGGLDGGSGGQRRKNLNENGSSSLLEEEPGRRDPTRIAQDPLASPSSSSSATDPQTDTTSITTNDDDDDNGDDDNNEEELAHSLERRLQLEIKHHPESVLLCGYFHEEIIDSCLSLSTYLPGVHGRELRVYYGEGVLKIAGARALYNLVQRFERSFALDEQLVDTDKIAAILHDGMLLVRVPLIPMPPPPRKIKVEEANPIMLFQDRKQMFCLDIDVPGVQRKDLTIYYSNGLLRLVWERLEPTTATNHAPTGGDTALTVTTALKQMRFEREIPINTINIDTEKLSAYLDKRVLTILAPKKIKRSARPIEVQSAKTLQSEGIEVDQK